MYSNYKNCGGDYCTQSVHRQLPFQGSLMIYQYPLDITLKSRQLLINILLFMKI